MPDDYGVLTPRDIERINEWLESRGIDKFRCPLCGKDEYAFGDQLVDLPAYHRQSTVNELGQVIEGDVYTYIQLCCTSCGATQLISADISGILKPDPLIEEAKKEEHNRVLEAVARAAREMKGGGS